MVRHLNILCQQWIGLGWSGELGELGQLDESSRLVYEDLTNQAESCGTHSYRTCLCVVGSASIYLSNFLIQM